MMDSPKPVLDRLTPAGAALLYAAFAALWIFASGYLLTFAVSDPLLHSRIELANGLVLVAVTSVLLYLLLRMRGATGILDTGGKPVGGRRLLLIFAALALVVPLIGFAITKLYGSQIEREAYANLEAIARLKAEQIENWMGERYGDSGVLAGDDAFAARVGQFVQHEQDTKLSKLILNRFEHLLTHYHYTKILLFDGNGRLLLRSGGDVTTSPIPEHVLRQTLDSKQVQRSDIYRDAEGDIHLEWAVPIIVPDAQGKHMVAVVVLRVTAQAFIYPLIQTWPSASASAETLLVRREGESVMFLNDLRHRRDSAMKLMLPMNSPELPAAAAIRAAKPGTVQGKDYRDAAVLAAYRPVAGTNWHILAKIDRDEVLKPMWDMVYWIGLIAFAAIAAIMAALLLLWRQQQRAQRLALAMQLAAATEESELQYRTLADSGQALIWASGTDKLCNYFNKVWLEFTGRSMEQELGNGWAEGVHPDDFQRCMEVYVSSFERREKFSMDYRLRRHDGEYRWIQDDGCPRYDSKGEFIGYIGYCLDITERKQAGQKQAESERHFRSLFENMLEGYAYCRMIFEQGVPRDFVYMEVNHAFETLTGLKDVLGKNVSAVIPGIRESNPELFEIYGRVALTGQPERFESYVEPLKTWFSVSVYCPEQEYFVAVFDNITARKADEARIQRLTQLYAALSQCNQAIVRCTDEAELFPQICRDAVQSGGMKMAWVGLLDPDAQTIRQVASFGDGAGQLQGLEIPVGTDSPFGRGSTGAAIRENRPYWCQDFQHDPLCASWHELGASSGWAASAALPLRRDGSVVGAFTLYAAEMNGFDEDARNLLTEMATDISFALDNFAHEARRERAENEARLLTQRITLATEAASIGIWDWHLQADQWCATPTYFTMLGYAPEEGFADRAVWLERIHPEDREAVAEKIRAVLAGNNAHYQYEARLRHADGAYRWIAVIGRVAERDENGKAIRMLGVRMDITERRHAEDSLRKLSLAVEQSPSSIVITDLKANIEYANKAFVKATGYSLDEAIGQNPRILHSGKNTKATYDDMWAHLTRGEVWKGELINRRKDGSEYIESALISPVRQADGSVTNYLAVKEDITEFKQAQEAIYKLNAELEEKVLARTADLDKARIEAEQANRSKSDFLAAMSHEIRTPMNGVVGMIDVLQQSSLTGPQKEMANIIHDSAYSLLVVINDILDFSKIEAGKLQIEIAPMDVAGVVDGACESLYQMALKKGVELTLFTDPAIPSQVMGDAGRLRQILVNLASNAIKFSSGQDKPGKVSMRAILVERTPDKHGRFPLLNPLDETTSHSTRLQEAAAKSLVIPQAGEEANESLRDVKQILLEFSVTDNGIGIDEATQARLFTPFTQADTSTTRAYGGTGLGLVISRRLTNIMGGDVAIQSEPGKGSIFSTRLTFDLPPEQPVTGEVSSLVTGLPCLVVGSNESLADDLAAYLAHDGAAVERAEGLAATQQWVARRPSGLCAVVVDTTDANTPLDELRAAVGAGVDVRFVAIERGGRRRCRIMATDLVALDAEVMHRRTFLEAVAIAAGRAKQPDLEERYGDASIPPQLSREEARRKGGLILVAEDNEINQKVILQQLMLLGRTADIANNGCEALELWRSGDYAILLADLHMPEMDGYELTAAIRAAETDAGATGKPRIPIVAFTANALKGEAERCLTLGMDDYLSKPVQLADLKAMLEKWLPVVSSDPIQEKTALTSENSSTGSIPIPSNSPLKGGECASGYAFHPPFQGEGWGGDGSNSAGKRSWVTSTPTATPVPVDVNVLKALVGDDEAMIREFLHDFRLSATKIAAELRTACAAGETAIAGALAHKLKSSSRSVGALELGKLCAALEKTGKDGDTEALKALLPRFEAEMAAVDEYLGSSWK